MSKLCMMGLWWMEREKDSGLYSGGCFLLIFIQLLFTFFVFFLLLLKRMVRFSVQKLYFHAVVCARFLAVCCKMNHPEQSLNLHRAPTMRLTQALPHPPTPSPERKKKNNMHTCFKGCPDSSPFCSFSQEKLMSNPLQGMHIILAQEDPVGLGPRVSSPINCKPSGISIKMLQLHKKLIDVVLLSYFLSWQNTHTHCYSTRTTNQLKTKQLEAP